MISYLIDGVLLVALAVTGWRVGLMYRELRRLRSHHREYERVFEDTGIAVEVVETAVRDINAHGAQILLALGDRIDEAYQTIDEIDARMDAAAEHLAAGRDVQSNVLPFAAHVQPARPQGLCEQPDGADREMRDRAPNLFPKAEKAVQWPSLGERFNQWRNSDPALKTAQRR